MNRANLPRCCASVVLALLALAPREASAHPQHYAQSAYLTVDPDRVTLELDLSPGSQVASAVVAVVDENGDGQIQEAEGRAYASKLLAEISLEIDGQARALSVTKQSLPPASHLATGEDKMSFTFVTALPAQEPGPHTIRFWNGHRPVESAYAAHTFTQTKMVTIQKQTRDATSQMLVAEYRVEGAPRAIASDGEGGGRWKQVALGLCFAGALGVSLVRARRRGRSAPKD